MLPSARKQPLKRFKQKSARQTTSFREKHICLGLQLCYRLFTEQLYEGISRQVEIRLGFVKISVCGSDAILEIQLKIRASKAGIFLFKVDAKARGYTLVAWRQFSAEIYAFELL